MIWRQSSVPKATLRQLKSANWERHWLQCLVWARRQARKYPWLDSMEHDIVQTAIEKTFSGERRWDPEICDLSHHLRMTIRSLYNNEIKKLKNREHHARLERAGRIDTDRTALAQERLDDLRDTLQRLRETAPDLADFFLAASRHLLDGCNNDSEIAAAMGMSPSQFSKCKARIAVVVADTSEVQAIRESKS